MNRVVAGTSSLPLGQVVMSNSNGVTFGLSGSTLTASIAGGGAGITNFNMSAGTTSQNLSNIVLSNSNGVSFGLNGSTVTASHNALTTAMASNRGSDFVQATATIAGTSITGTIASNGLSLSVGPYITTAMQSNRGSDFVQATAGFNGTNASGTIASNAVSVSVAAPVTVATLSRSFFPDHQFTFNNGIASGMSQNGLSVQFLPCAHYLSGSRVHAFASVNVNAGVNSTGALTCSAWMGLYTLTGSTLSLASSGSATYSASWSSNTTGSVNGPRRLSVPMNVNMTPGDYWAGVVVQTASENLTHNMTMFNGNTINGMNSFGDLGVAGATSQGLPPCIGMYTATTNAMPASIGVSEINQTSTAFFRANLIVEIANRTLW